MKCSTIMVYSFVISKKEYKIAIFNVFQKTYLNALLSPPVHQFAQNWVHLSDEDKKELVQTGSQVIDRGKAS